MLDLCKLIFGTVIDLLRSRATLEAEIVVLRQQINVLRRASPKRRPFGAIDRLILGGVCRLFPKSYDALAIVRPDTVIRWHRAGFQIVLALEIATPLQPTDCVVGNSPVPVGNSILLATDIESGDAPALCQRSVA